MYTNNSIITSITIMFILNVFLMVYSNGFNTKSKNTLDKVVDGVYFSTTTFSTSGFGDILPVTNWSKCIMILQHAILLYIMTNKLDKESFDFVFKGIIFIFVLNVLLMVNTDGFSNVSNKESNKVLDGIYFSSTISTVGYGDIYPVKNWSKCIVILEQLLIMYITINAIKMYINQLQL